MRITGIKEVRNIQIVVLISVLVSVVPWQDSPTKYENLYLIMFKSSKRRLA